MSASSVSTPTLQVYQTAEESGPETCLIPQPEHRGSLTGQTFQIHLDREKQRMIGFGAAMTESAAYALSHLNSEKRKEVLSRYFSEDEGLGYSIVRTHMNSCDFSLGNWACVETAGDTDLKSFSLDRYEQYIFPALREAIALRGKALPLLISPWSPPAWMKSNGEMNNGGTLLPQYRATWANYYVRFIKELEELGFPVFGLTVQNEPAAKQVWDSCLYSAEEERDFVRDHLGPAMYEAGYDDKAIIIWDHNRDLLVERASIAYDDPDAAKYIWGAGLHWYSGDQFDHLETIHQRYPDKHLMFTEGCWEGGVKLGKWDRGERYAHHIIGDLRNWTEAWIDWNLALDHTGGPNHVGNLCDSPVIINTETGDVHYQTSFAYIGHFSRFIKPEATILDSDSGDGPLEFLPARNPDGQLVVVVLNRSDERHDFTISTSQKPDISSSIPPHSIQTWCLTLS